MLPNLKLGLDGRTGLNRFLTAWKSPDDPATCRSLRLNPNGSPQLFLYEGQIPRWRSGHCNGLRWTGVPILQVRINFNVSFVNNDDELTIMWGVRNRSIFSRLVADEPGSVQRFTWHEQIAKWDVFWSAPTDQCDNYGRCGAYGKCDPYDAYNFECTCLPGYQPKSISDWYLRDGSGGCIQKNLTGMCNNGEGFVKVENVKVPDPSTARVDNNLDLKACMEQCLIQECSLREDRISQYDKKSRGFLSKKGMLAGLVLPIADGTSASSSRLTFSSKRAQEDQLIDMVDNSSEDMQLHRLEAAEMMRVAIWCLQSDHTRRPSMSTVVKVLEGTMGVEADLDYCLQNATTMAAIRREAVLGSTTHFCHHYYQDQGEERSFAIYMWCLCFSDRCFTFSSLYIASVMLSGKLFN
ncbi:G-type lectin S-receptor-like serine/threonine-protein kinase RKS1 [Populus alba x Populus x berolinensis]|uniref:non-specific serine/threonine protein kinase n=1 Tax=Populus alba x Populus x berolinensis TaxID=444605 RepID=A0AAD6VU03_9ROSI|nr:G-type lectin S-receptor-like serine/threonine-protein kinase RKS1 [Populus alba x Populus x berolinensis]